VIVSISVGTHQIYFISAGRLGQIGDFRERNYGARFGCNFGWRHLSTAVLRRRFAFLLRSFFVRIEIIKARRHEDQVGPICLRRSCTYTLQGPHEFNSVSRLVGATMSEWYLWDGEQQRGPMDRRELDNCIQYHPNQKMVRIWRDGFPGWKSIEEAFDVDRKTLSVPTSLERPHDASEKSKSENFIVKNWRGEYPLWVSYWIIGLLSNVVATVVVAGVSSTFSATSYNPVAILAFLLTLWSLTTLLSVWQLVGVWRSAQRRIVDLAAIGRRAPWAWLAKCMVFLGGLHIASLLIRSAMPQITEAANMAFMGDPDIPPYSIRVLNNGTEAEISGGIKFGLTSDFQKILDASRGIRVVHLDSIGGRIGEGKKLNALIKQRGLETYADVKCLSACTLGFVAGHQRVLKQGAQLGFHRASFAGEDEIDGSIERTIYGATGISTAFIERVLATKNSEMWRPSERELLSAGVITSVSSGDEYAMSTGGGEVTRDDWDRGLQMASPVYSVLRDKYPKTYSEILDTFVSGTMKGLPQAQVIGQTRAKLNGLIKTLLPYSDDTVLIDFGRLVVDQYRAIQLQDSAACYRFASGQGDPAVTRMIPAQLAQRELSLDAQILSSAQKQNKSAGDEIAWDKIRAGLSLEGYTAADLKLLAEDSIGPSDYARYCEVTIALYQEIVKLPTEEAAAALRGIFSN
jgi:hypothetical protein